MIINFRPAGKNIHFIFNKGITHYPGGFLEINVDAS